MMTALDAFSIDAILPALGSISDELALRHDNHRQFVITSIFLGFSLGVLVYGFVSDSVGRRLPVLCGFAVYVVGSLVCVSASDFGVLIGGRLLQGFGAAGPYVLAMAVIRDLYSGREMARLVSLVMMVFIAVPAIAPLVGQGLLLLTGWRGIFLAFLIFAMITCFWFFRRLPETLPIERRRKLNPGDIREAFMDVFAHRQSRFYLLAIGCITGPFITYLSTGQQVFQEIYSLGRLFPLVFASIALVFGLASYCNEKWVQTLGMRRLVGRALLCVALVSLFFLLASIWLDSPPLWMYVLYMTVVMFCFGPLFGNMMALALEPMGHIAGSASSVVNAVSTAIAVLVAIAIGSQLSANVYPIVVGFGVACGVLLILNFREFYSTESDHI